MFTAQKSVNILNERENRNFIYKVIKKFYQIMISIVKNFCYSDYHGRCIRVYKLHFLFNRVAFDLFKLTFTYLYSYKSYTTNCLV